MYYLSVLLLLIIFLWPAINYAHTNPPLTLSKLYQATEDLSQYWVSEKYDGIRAYWDGKQLMTRSGKTINAPRSWLSKLPVEPLDGELWIGHNRFDLVSGIARKKEADPTEWLSIKFMVFDMPAHKGTFIERYYALKTLIQSADNPRLRLVEQVPIHSHQALQAQLKETTQRGAEGLMLRKISAHYQPGRTNDLLKVKPYMDSEAIVIDHQTGSGKYADMLGALIVMDNRGKEFKIGTGFSDQQRKNPPKKGETITYQYHGYTKTGLPRFASFLRIRKEP